jgi:two-component system, OmpR family, sensor histidine kinase SenX3
MAVGWRRRASGAGSRPAGQPNPTGQPHPATEPAADAVAALRTGVLVLDAADRPVLVNPAAYELGLVRNDPAQPVHPAVRSLAGQVRRSDAARDVELDLPRSGPLGQSTEPLGVHLRVVPLSGPDYPAGHVAVEATDVTEAHRVARVRRDFVANVSHELKTPVGALQLLAETLLEAADDPAATRRFAQRILHESRRMSRLVSELLELSRLQGAEPLPAPVRVQVDRLMNEVMDRSRTAAAAKRIEVVASGRRGLTVYGDEDQLVTAVANLVENAISYSAEDTRVSIVTDELAGTVQIQVIDQGIGIARADLDRIFERFYRADQARSRVTGGTGLGLAIVKHIAVNHGGQVQVASTLGHGSTFTIRLPAHSPEAAAPTPVGSDLL